MARGGVDERDVVVVVVGLRSSLMPGRDVHTASVPSNYWCPLLRAEVTFNQCGADEDVVANCSAATWC